VHNPTKEQSYKWKADPIILKVAIVAEQKRKQRKKNEELKNKEE